MAGTSRIPPSANRHNRAPVPDRTEPENRTKLVATGRKARAATKSRNQVDGSPRLVLDLVLCFFKIADKSG